MSTTPPCGSVHIAEHPQSVHLGQTLNISFPGIPTPFNVSFFANTEKGGATHCWYDRWLFNESWREYQVQPLNQSGLPPREGDDVVWDEGHNIMFVAHDADDGAFIFSDAYHVAAASGLRRSMGALGWSCVVLASLAVVGGWHA